jgi:hypothetical protein
MLSFVTIFAAVLVHATGDPALVVAARNGDFGRSAHADREPRFVNEPARDGCAVALGGIIPTCEWCALVAAGAN